MDILATSGDINIILIALAFFIVIVSMDNAFVGNGRHHDIHHGLCLLCHKHR